MNLSEAIGTIELGRWRLTDKEKDAIQTVIALALEAEEMQAQMAAQDAQIEKLCKLTRRGTSCKMPFSPQGE